MTDAEKREKVMRGLECCNNNQDCENCPYAGVGMCEYWLRYDTFNLMKEQKPRVLTTEEVAQIEPNTVYWGEGHHVRNLWPMAFTDEAIEDSDSGFLKDSYGRIYEVELYNKGVMGWRLWTSRPTEEQRMEVLWE